MKTLTSVEIVPLFRNCNFGVEFLVCTNAETLGVNLDNLPYSRDEFFSMFLSDLRDLIVGSCIVYLDRNKELKFTLRENIAEHRYQHASAKLAIRAYRRTDDDLDWCRVPDRDLPARVAGEISDLYGYLAREIEIEIRYWNSIANSDE